MLAIVAGENWISNPTSAHRTASISSCSALVGAASSSRRAHAPQGISGGGPALRGEQRLITPDGAVKELPGCFSVTVQLGDVIEIKTPGGGGFGSRAAS